MRLHPADSLLYLFVRLVRTLDHRKFDISSLRPDTVRNILVVSSTAIGDTLLSTPAIRALRERYPRAHIIAHLNVKNSELFENNPHIDGVIPYYGGYKRFFGTIRDLRRHDFDLALILHGNEPQATPMAYLSGARYIVKVPIPKQYAFLLSNQSNGFEDPWKHHAIDVRLRAASFVGCRSDDPTMVLIVDKADETSVDAYLERIALRGHDTSIGFQAAAATRYKEWPERNFVELGRKLCSHRKDIRIILTGSQHEQPLCNRIVRGIGQRAVSTAGAIPLKQLPALVKRMRVLVTNDTGALHIATALQTRTVSLFCPTNHRGVGPIQDLHLHRMIVKKRPCNPCVTKKCKRPFCMEQITVDEVFNAVRGFLDENRSV